MKRVDGLQTTPLSRLAVVVPVKAFIPGAALLFALSVSSIQASPRIEPQVTVMVNNSYVTTAESLATVALDIALISDDFSKPLGGFDLCLAYDTSVLKLYYYDWALIRDCQWSFDFVQIPLDRPVPPNISLRLVGIDTSHSGCFDSGTRTITLTFVVKDKILFHGSSTALEFYWITCSDNTLWTASPDTILLAAQVIDAEGADITNKNHPLPSFTGPDSTCMDPAAHSGLRVIEAIRFHGGKVTFVSPDSIGVRGDVNLNGLSFEEEDLSVLSRFFLFGDSVFSVDGSRQVEASNVDGDAVDTTLADLISLRYTLIGNTGGSLAGAFGDEAKFVYYDLAGALKVAIDANRPVGAWCLWFQVANQSIDSIVFEGSGDPGPYGGPSWYLLSDTLRMSFVGGTPNEPVISSGLTDIVTIYYHGPSPEPTIERASSVDGVNFQFGPTGIHDAGFSADDPLLPAFLLQNHPNPFNPTTTIEFVLSRRADWQLEIFNLTGQRLTEYQGRSGPGRIVLPWNGVDMTGVAVSSGVYFYRLTAGDLRLSRKMLLVR
ncbi:MAG TPA: T9SS type A sorting domain-containing protein [Candidatus Deferrimicrobium sp.]|nr:T9SS type A sorting domain-containing protein [Candidatus Deferrimicrobium sp.]